MRRLLTSRKAVSSMIGGIIILTLFLSALSMMVFISQQYDTYQSTVENMNSRDIDAFSENLVPTYPGLDLSNPTNGIITYVLYVSNYAAVGTQVVRIYINSTIGPCASLCIFDPSNTPGTPSTFLANTSFVNPSEYKHPVILYTGPSTEDNTLPSGAPGVNSIAIATYRGRIFSFQWPIPQTPSQPSYLVPTGGKTSQWVMQIAYQGSGNPGYNSKNEPVAVNPPYNSGGTVTSGIYCHSESTATEVVTGTGYGTLWFVDPWVTRQIFSNVFPLQGTTNDTSFYVAVNVMNNQNSTISITRGNIWLQLVVPNEPGGVAVPGVDPMLVLTLGGYLIGTYVAATSTFTLAGQETTVASNDPVLLIYRINTWSWALDTNIAGELGNILPSGVAYSGVATIANEQHDASYFSGVLQVSLYVAPSC